MKIITMQIRQAKNQDIADIMNLLVELGRPKPRNKLEKAKFRKVIRNYIAHKDKDILVAVVVNNNAKKLVGMASIALLPRLNHATPELWIPELVVHGDYRNKGVGKKLIEACISKASKNRCFRIRLESGNERKTSHAFYAKLGFEQYALSFKKSFA
jgi:N-acetylglutamate synthase-like GNAT family acetyltransferase